MPRNCVLNAFDSSCFLHFICTFWRTMKPHESQTCFKMQVNRPPSSALTQESLPESKKWTQAIRWMTWSSWTLNILKKACMNCLTSAYQQTAQIWSVQELLHVVLRRSISLLWSHFLRAWHCFEHPGTPSVRRPRLWQSERLDLDLSTLSLSPIAWLTLLAPVGAFVWRFTTLGRLRKGAE